MNKITQPVADQEQALSAKDAAYYDARTLQGLKEAEAGLGIPVDEAIERMEARIAQAKQTRA